MRRLILGGYALTKTQQNSGAITGHASSPRIISAAANKSLSGKMAEKNRMSYRRGF